MGDITGFSACSVINNNDSFYIFDPHSRDMLLVYFASYLFHICEYYLSIIGTYYGYLSWVLKHSSTQVLSLSLSIKLKETLYMV